jgi:bifunctional non-homologous end joining protein LigD
MGFRRKKPAAIGIKAPYPGFIEPELATAIDNVPLGKRWLQEIKFDSYRMQVHLGDAAVKVFTRRGHVGETSWIVFLLRRTITNQRTAR